MVQLKKLLASPLFKETALYGLTNALFTGLPLILMPFLVAVMAPEDYGTLDLFKSLTLVLTPILGLSTIQSVTRFYYDLDTNDFRKFCSTVIIFHFISAISASVVLFFVSLMIESEYLIIVLLSVAFFLFNQITEVLLIIYRVKKQPKNFMIIRLGSVVLDLLLLVLLYHLYDTYDWHFRVIPNVIATVAIGLMSLCILHFQFAIKTTFSLRLFKDAVAFSAPLILHMISGYILNVGDRFFIVHFLGDKALGSYSVGYQLGMSISFFYTSFNLAWTPTFYEWMKSGRFSAIEKVKKIVFFGLPILGFVLVIAWQGLSKYIDNLAKYDIDLKLIVSIVLAYIILSYYKFNANYFFYAKKTKKIASITLLSAVLSIVGNFLLIPRLGLMGAAYTTLVSFTIMSIIVVRVKNKLTIEKHEKSIL
ncbi:hypothetical protein ED312_18635 [Sinomicrobium pectinilyticum]|uniref:Uncharacterized protein n=1 Tax=Sinomicrobium pectinilyticum TaxID=1084421 RepID=A0A3N0E1A7_SINP1|nr:oligosaccharide flippase family protein [Sinomicrobium pectinilyticum]RNL81627.1 hypothetical protein ED312_18635 [Sinomicrobium pectinilyticum]